MKAARFSGEDDRRRFYGEPDRPSASAEFEFGAEWSVATDPGAQYAVRWVEDTHEIRAVRQPQPRPPMEDEPVLLSSWPLLVDSTGSGSELLGWADSAEALTDALEGWELQMHEDDSLLWVRYRLAEAAAGTDRRRGRS